MAKDTFVTLQEAWTARDWETVRTLETDDLFRLHNKQLQEYIRLGRINVMERICVNQAYLHKYEREEQYEHITVYLTTRMRDYIIDEKTKKVLMGDPNKDIFGKYLMKFTRTYGITTQTASSEAGRTHSGLPALRRTHSCHAERKVRILWLHHRDRDTCMGALRLGRRQAGNAH